MPAFSRTASLLAAMILGALVPQAHLLAAGIKWLVMGMLFLVFLQIRLSNLALRRSHGFLLAANIALGLGAWAAGHALGGRDIALAAFFAAIAPTATAAPVIIAFLRGRVEYVVTAFLISNLSIAALLPLLLPIVLGHATPSAFLDVLGSVGLVVFTPILSARILRAIHPRSIEWPARLGNVSFAMWVATLFLITSNASHFVRQQAGTPLLVVALVAGTSLLVCAASFAIGRCIGGAEFAREAGQSLGQKNTALTIYLALTYAGPVVALGPTCYVVWHNLWNSWQLRHPSRGCGAQPGHLPPPQQQPNRSRSSIS